MYCVNFYLYFIMSILIINSFISFFSFISKIIAEIINETNNKKMALGKK